MDKLSKEQRHKNMAAIHYWDTKLKCWYESSCSVMDSAIASTIHLQDYKTLSDNFSHQWQLPSFSR